jgi:oxygen-dependent protoporphyrinogen oxidase
MDRPALPFDVAIIGGGISGLTAARELCARGLRVRLLERTERCGGLIETDRTGGFVIDTGPDTLLAHKPAALALVKALGLEPDLVAPLPARTTYVVRHRVLRSLPETSALGLPTSWRTVVGARAFSWHGRVRMAAEVCLPSAPPPGDESIGSFVRRRFGREAEAYVAEPILAGLHRGDASRLSMQALFPFLARAEREHGSVARAWQKMPARSGPGSMSLRQGLGVIPERLAATLPPGVVRLGAPVARIERGGRYRIVLENGSSVTAQAVLIATPAHAAARMLQPLDPHLAQGCASTAYRSAITVALGYHSPSVGMPLHGWGFVVPAGERRHVRSASWVTSKWPARAPEGCTLLRLSLHDEESTMARSDMSLAAAAHEDIRALLKISADPILARVYRRPQAMPQLEVGHLERMAAIDAAFDAQPGLFVSSAGFRGVGLPDCIADARAVARRAADFIAGLPTTSTAA